MAITNPLGISGRLFFALAASVTRKMADVPAEKGVVEPIETQRVEITAR